MTRAQAAWSRIAGAAAAALAAIVGVGGCYDGVDPLDPEVLAEVARSRGDAQGFERSGIYAGTVEVLECSCDSTLMDAGLDVSLCLSFDQLEMAGLPPTLDLEIVQADGTVRVRPLAFATVITADSQLLPVFYGPLHADGRLSAAGVLQSDVVAAQGQVLGRVDGTLERVDGQWGLVAEYRQRYAVDFITQPDVLDVAIDDEGTRTSVDCRERLALDLVWIAPPFEPLGG